MERREGDEETDRLTDNDRLMVREMDGQTDRWIDRKTDRQNWLCNHNLAPVVTDRCRIKKVTRSNLLFKTERQTDGQTDRQRDRETDR